MKISTLCFLVSDGKILLGMKKERFGVGKWNGFGGKVEEGESVTEGAMREMKEESGVSIFPEHLEKAAVIDFIYIEKPEWDQQVHIFVARAGEGEPSESGEMRPQWFPLDSLPYESMWVDDPLWLPRILRGELLKATIRFGGTGESIEFHDIQTVPERILLA